jgi:dihydrofolate reductase
MEICVIWSKAAERVAGGEGAPGGSDNLRYFDDVTCGHPVVMGRRTWESLPAALPGRQNIVLSSQKLAPKGAAHCESLPEALTLASVLKPAKVFVIGGAELSTKALRVADRLYVTRPGGEDLDADAFAPDVDLRQFTLVQRHTRAGASGEMLVFEEYRRRRMH